MDNFPMPVRVSVAIHSLKPNSITLASSELAPNMFGASSELASVMEFGFYGVHACTRSMSSYLSVQGIF